MGLGFDAANGQTPLDEEEIDGLRIIAITTKSELDEFEQQNIEQAVLWTIGRRLNRQQLLSEAFIQSLHRRMFGDVWKWAGQFRQTEKNIGVEYWKIPIELRQLLEDTLYWINNTTFPDDEIALRFKHRLVSIHCFPNGNGRHSRLMADLIVTNVFGKKVFTWGQSATQLSKTITVRSNYLKALKAADRGDYQELVEFARE